MTIKKTKDQSKIQGKNLTAEEVNKLAEETRAQLRKKLYKEAGVHLRLREARERMKQTQAGMATYFETTQSYYSTYEDGERMVTAPMLMFLLKEGFSADYILSDKGSIWLSDREVSSSMDYAILKNENDHLKSENEFLKKQVADLMDVLKKK